MVKNSIGLQGRTGGVTQRSAVGPSVQLTILAVPTACSSAIGIGCGLSVRKNPANWRGEAREARRCYAGLRLDMSSLLQALLLLGAVLWVCWRSRSNAPFQW